MHPPHPQNPWECHLYIAEGCHLYIAHTKSDAYEVFWKISRANHIYMGLVNDRWQTLLSPKTDIFEQQYKEAAAEGALYELRLRLLADKIPALQQSAYRERLEGVEDLIVGHFGSALLAEDATLLKRCRQLRNKILHCDFAAARKKLEELGANPQHGNVRRVDVRGLSGREMIDKIRDVRANVIGSFQYVSASPTAAGAVLAWLIEAGVAGDLKLAAESFAEAAAIIERLAMIG